MSNNTIQITINMHLSDSHLMYAMILAIEAAAIEEKYTQIKNYLSREYANNLRKYNANIISSILLTTSFLESKINEFFSDAANGMLTPENKSEEELIIKLSNNWINGIPRKGKFSVFEKYAKGLEIGNNEKLEKGVLPNQDILLLTELRNLLVHHESEVVKTNISKSFYSSEQTIEKKLENKYRLNPFVAIGNPFFPDKCLSLGCSCWAIIRAIEFIEMFFKKLGMSRYIDEFFKTIKDYYTQLKEIHKNNNLRRFDYKL